MKELEVRNRRQDGATGPTSEAGRKRAAVELIRSHDRQLRWTARRFSICAEDGEDAYQRGIEILLEKAPTSEVRQLLPWTRTVIKHEALAIRKVRERTLGRPAGNPEEPDEDWVQLIPATGDGPDEMAVRRERVARSREALAQLKPAELKALTQLAEGFSYAEIGELNDWTRTKVNRCLAEGRARFRSVFRESEAGERCDLFEPLISASCDGELDEERAGDLENHLAACGHCRSTLKAYRAAPRAAAALAPAIPMRGLWDRLQELAISAHMRLSGAGRGSDAGLQGVFASGGTRGAGAAALAKFAAICAGTAGTAAVCVATGVMPSVGVLHREKPDSAERPAISRVVDRQQVEVEAPPVEANAERPVNAPSVKPDPEPVEPVEPEPSEPAPPPAPTVTETEFTPEAAGTSVPAPAPTQTKTSSSPVPVGNGGGEFAP